MLSPRFSFKACSTVLCQFSLSVFVLRDFTVRVLDRVLALLWTNCVTLCEYIMYFTVACMMFQMVG